MFLNGLPVGKSQGEARLLSSSLTITHNLHGVRCHLPYLLIVDLGSPGLLTAGLSNSSHHRSCDLHEIRDRQSTFLLKRAFFPILKLSLAVLHM